MTTGRTSLLTQGLAPLAQHSAKIRDLLDRLYALDDELQAAHERARRDDEFGEQVVVRYKRFLALRQILIDELEQQRIAVPWQMRMRIDEIELTLRQREEKQNGKPETAAARAASKDTRSGGAAPKSELQVDAAPPASARERRVVMLLVPSLIVLVLALLWYQWFS